MVLSGRAFRIILLLLLIILPTGSFSPIPSHIQANSNSELVVEMSIPNCEKVRDAKLISCFKDFERKKRKNKRSRDICLRKANEEERKCRENMPLEK
jgi:hypothetical protein